MISKLSDKCCKKEEKPFPKLMAHKSFGRVVLFSSKSTGVCVFDGDADWPVGKHSSTWNDSCYEDYEGDVCLTND